MNSILNFKETIAEFKKYNAWLVENSALSVHKEHTISWQGGAPKWFLRNCGVNLSTPYGLLRVQRFVEGWIVFRDDATLTNHCTEQMTVFLSVKNARRAALLHKADGYSDIASSEVGDGLYWNMKAACGHSRLRKANIQRRHPIAA